MRCRKMSERENSCDLPSGDVLFDSSASIIPEYEYERSEKLENIKSEKS